MPNYLKPQSPIQLNDNYIYPLTTADQVITEIIDELNLKQAGILPLLKHKK